MHDGVVDETQAVENHRLGKGCNEVEMSVHTKSREGAKVSTCWNEAASCTVVCKNNLNSSSFSPPSALPN